MKISPAPGFGTVERRRLEYNLTVSDLCRRAGVSTSNYRYSQAGRVIPSRRFLRLCFRALRAARYRVDIDIGARAGWCAACGLLAGRSDVVAGGISADEIIYAAPKCYHDPRDRLIARLRREALYLAVIAFNIRQKRLALAAGVTRPYVSSACAAIEGERDDGTTLGAWMTWAEDVLSAPFQQRAAA